jgi:hypothetical protein
MNHAQDAHAIGKLLQYPGKLNRADLTVRPAELFTKDPKISGCTLIQTELTEPEQQCP